MQQQTNPFTRLYFKSNNQLTTVDLKEKKKITQKQIKFKRDDDFSNNEKERAEK
jgi:hypothetical protein